MRLSTSNLTKPEEKKVELEEKKPDSEMAYKIKLLVFFIVSFFLVFNAMTPTRKCAPPKRNR